MAERLYSPPSKTMGLQGSSRQQQLLQTPAFLTRLLNGANMDDFYQDSERVAVDVLGSIENSDIRSQVISLNEMGEDFQPVMFSKINRNFKKYLKRQLVSRIRNDLDELRAAQVELSQYAQRQREEIEAFIGESSKKALLSVKKHQANSCASSQLMQQIIDSKNKIISLQSSLREKSLQNSRLSRQISDLKSSLDHQKRKQHKMNKRSTNQSRSSLFQSIAHNCSNCKILQIKNATVREQLLRCEKEIEELLICNENLQEQIFDVEQKQARIELEVEQQVSERLKKLDLPPKKMESWKAEQQGFLELIRKMNDENAALNEKCQKLQRQCLKEHELKEKERELMNKQQDYHRLESQYFQAKMRQEQNLEKFYDRQREIILAEENISQRIEELKKKEGEIASAKQLLSSRERRAERGQTQMSSFMPPSIENRAEEAFNFQEELLNSNMNSFGKIQERNDRYNTEQEASGLVRNLRNMQSVKSDERLNLYNNIQIPELPIGKQRQQRQDLPEHDHHSKKHFSSALPSKSTANIYTNLMQKQKESNRREISPLRQYLPSSKSGAISRSPPRNFRQVSSNSRVSAVGMRSNQLQNSAVSQQPRVAVRQRPQMKGLGSKLDRLREQIKREIQSIK